MNELVASLAFAYSYGLVPTTYTMSVELIGDIPLGKPTQGKALLNIEFQVSGDRSSKPNVRTATHELTKFESFLNGAKLPFTLTSVKPLFPRTDVEHSELGAVLSNSSKVKMLPSMMPGLDPQRFPEFTYLPVPFPKTQLSTGMSWTYVIPFSGSDVKFTAQVLKVSDHWLDVAVELAQESVSYEDAEFRPLSGPEGAAYKVESKLKGKGSLRFDAKLGHLQESKVVTVADSVVNGIVNDYRADRKLQTTLTVAKSPKSGDKSQGH